MQITLDTEIIERLSSKGILAYVAITLGDGQELTTASLAASVHCDSSAMSNGINELILEYPAMVGKNKRKWRCGVIKVGAGEVVQNLDPATERRIVFIDDLKKYWDWGNAPLGFTMNSLDGVAINRFLRLHKDWTQETWRAALRNRCKSQVNHAQAMYVWVEKLAEYAAAPLDRFGKPMMNGGGKHEEAATIRQSNREAVGRAVANA